MAAPPQGAPAQAPSDQTGGATTESVDVDEANEEVLEVEVEAVWEDDEEEELDPRTLGVPGLRTLVPGDHVEVLWANGAFFLPLSCSPTRTRDLRLRTWAAPRARRLGEGASQGVRARDAGTPARHHLPHHVSRRRGGYRRLHCHTAWTQSAPTTHAPPPRGATGGRGPAHAPGTASLRGGGRGGRAVRPAVPEHAEK